MSAVDWVTLVAGLVVVLALGVVVRAVNGRVFDRMARREAERRARRRRALDGLRGVAAPPDDTGSTAAAPAPSEPEDRQP